MNRPVMKTKVRKERKVRKKRKRKMGYESHIKPNSAKHVASYGRGFLNCSIYIKEDTNLSMKEGSHTA
jgi:hypothetical protein